MRILNFLALIDFEEDSWVSDLEISGKVGNFELAGSLKSDTLSVQ